MTGLLLSSYPNLTAIEVDDEAVEHLKAQHPNLSILHKDVLNVDWSEFGGFVL